MTFEVLLCLFIISRVVKTTDVVQNIITQLGNVQTRISDMLY